VTYDPQAKPFLGVLHLSSQHGPSPVFKPVFKEDRPMPRVSVGHDWCAGFGDGSALGWSSFV